MQRDHHKLNASECIVVILTGRILNCSYWTANLFEVQKRIILEPTLGKFDLLMVGPLYITKHIPENVWLQLRLSMYKAFCSEINSSLYFPFPLLRCYIQENSNTYWHFPRSFFLLPINYSGKILLGYMNRWVPD